MFVVVPILRWFGRGYFSPAPCCPSTARLHPRFHAKTAWGAEGCIVKLERGDYVRHLKDGVGELHECPLYRAAIFGKYCRKADVRAGTLSLLKTRVNQLSKSCSLDVLRCFAASAISPLLS